MVIDPGNNLNSTNAASSGTAKTRPAASQKNPASSPENNPKAASDSVSLSEKGQVLAKLAAELSGEAEINHDKVAEVRAALATGSYQVDAEAITDRLLQQDSSF